MPSVILGCFYKSLLVCLLTSLWLTTSTGFCRDMTGKGGIGTLAKLNQNQSVKPSLLIRYWQKETAIEFLAGVDWQLEDETSEPTLGFFQMGFGLHKVLVHSRRLNGTIGVRAWGHYGWSQTKLIDQMVECNRLSYKSKVQNQLNVVLEVPFQAEFFLSDHASIVASVGLSIRWQSAYTDVSETESNTDISEFLGKRAKKSGFLVDLGGRYNGGIGFTYYF